MLSLEVQISKHTNRWVDVTNDFLTSLAAISLSGRKHWRTMKGVENFIDKAINDLAPWLTRENFRINGTEEGTPQADRPPPPTWKCMWGTSLSALGVTA